MLKRDMAPLLGEKIAGAGFSGDFRRIWGRTDRGPYVVVGKTLNPAATFHLTLDQYGLSWRATMEPSQNSPSSGCVQCHGPLPEGRTRFCSDKCLTQYKREKERAHYGHRHHYSCTDCGHELHLGRRRK